MHAEDTDCRDLRQGGSHSAPITAPLLVAGMNGGDAELISRDDHQRGREGASRQQGDGVVLNDD